MPTHTPTALPGEMPHRHLLGTRIDVINYHTAVSRIMAWAFNRESRYVCVSPVHLVMESYDSPVIRRVVNRADMVTPDGMPVVWSLRLLGSPEASRVYGPSLTRELLKAAERAHVAVGFYGATDETIAKLKAALARDYPDLQVGYTYAPPFRPLTAEEDARVVDDMNRSGIRLLFVGLGCPKQDLWVSAHRPQVQAVMLAVGAAFDFLSGTKAQAPVWMQNSGLEWAFRLCTEPRRLFVRYMKHNPRFVALLFTQWLRTSKDQPVAGRAAPL
jgi:N-acetylglucosaminyldiphosphoundecaprenol N-acetyl-beta-D-mannosaminyltransferase